MHVPWMSTVALSAIVVGVGAAIAIGTSVTDHLPSAVFGVAVQTLVSIVMVTLHRPWWLASCVGFLGSSVLLLSPQPWPRLIHLGAVPWLAVVLAWSAVLAVQGLRAPRDALVPVVAAALFLTAAAISAPTNPVLTAAGLSAPILGGATVGLWVRLRSLERERAAAQLERLRMHHRQAVLAERQAVATRLHDDLGHVLTLILLNSRSIGTRSTEPAALALGQQVSVLADDGLAIMRDTVSTTLHPAAQPPHPAESHDLTEQITALVTQVRSSGQQIRLELPPLPSPIPASTVRAAYRTVKEGLTNIRRHAPGAAGVILIQHCDHQLTVKVSNEAPHLEASTPTTPGSGLGLTALTRGVTLLGGTVHHGPRSDGAYTLTVTLPAAPPS